MKTILLALTATLTATTTLTAGPVSTLYAISAGGMRTGYIIQGSSSTSFSLSTDQSAIAVLTTARVLGAAFSGGTGAEYTLAGVATGTTYSYPGNGAPFYDGTTDGTHNYSVDYYSGDVYSFGLDWSNPSVIFSTGDGSGRDVGITWDSGSNALWVSNLSPLKLTKFSMTGTVVTSFSTTQQLLALAYDPADGTLWGSTDPNNLYQYSTTGTLLSSNTYTALSQNNSIRGMEFAETGSTAPEPGTVTSSLGGVLLLAGWLARRKHT